MDQTIIESILNFINKNICANLYYIFSREEIIQRVLMRNIMFVASVEKEYLKEQLNSGGYLRHKTNYWIDIFVRAKYFDEVEPDYFVLQMDARDNKFATYDIFIGALYDRIIQLERIGCAAPLERTESAMRVMKNAAAADDEE